MVALIGLTALAFNPLAGIQRTMSAFERGETVRLLFYGQSITEQVWTRMVVDDLHQRYPRVNLEWENRAIGGFAADKLSRTLESDLLTCWPDLVIFHDYGAESQYDPMIAWMRTHTSAEVLIQSDHITWSPDPKHPIAKPPKGEAWHDRREKSLRQLAEKWGCGFVDVRSQWRKQLAQSQKPASFYLSDGTHLNDVGTGFMARVISNSLRLDKSVQSKPAFSTQVADSVTVDGAVRVDVRCAEDTEISGTTDTWICTRSTGFGRIPLLKRATPGDNPIAEEWTVTLSNVKSDGTFHFRLSGSLSDFDGEGDSDQDFVSNSGRLRIEAKDWEGTYMALVAQGDWTDGFAVKFDTLHLSSPEVEGNGEWHAVQYGPFSGELKANRPVEWRIWSPGAK